MPDMLKAEPFLGGHSLDLGEVAVAEVTDIAIVSIATPLGGGDTLASAVQAASIWLVISMSDCDGVGSPEG